MSRLASIKQGLIDINETVFQELCDGFLNQKHSNYKAFVRSGAHETKQKTTKGSPDTWLQHPNGDYLLMEATTLKNDGNKLVRKLKSDIDACLDVNKTGIKLSEISDIVLCYTCNLDASQIREVNQSAIKKIGVRPQHFNLDAIAHELLYHHKNIAHEYLNVSLDSGQIISLSQFIKENSSSKLKLATPLSNVFLHRSEELKSFKKMLANKDLVILSGPSGVGKTKLALEGITQFIEENIEFNGFAVSPKGAEILPDLNSYFNNERNGVLLVDDVNRIEIFNQILAYYKSIEESRFKLILTIRDYAYEQLRETLSEFKIDEVIKLSEFSYEEIKLILASKPFQITNHDFQWKIWEIAKGNARLSIMLAIRALEMQTLDTFTNVLDLFDDYFGVFLKDNLILKNKTTVKVLGLLSFFFNLPMSESVFNSIESKFKLPKGSMTDEVEKLHELDIIEIHNDYIKVSEQNVATYFFYKVFIDQQLLSFETLWKNYHSSFANRIRDSLQPSFSHFGEDKVKSIVYPILSNSWNSVSRDQNENLQFLDLTWYLIPNICFNYIQSFIDSSNSISSIQSIPVETKYKQNDFSLMSKNERHLQLLGRFLKSEKHHLTSLRISFEFILKHPEHLPQLCYQIDGNYIIENEDIKNILFRQEQLMEFFELNVDKNRFFALSFIANSSQAIKRFRWKYNSEDTEEEDDVLITKVKSLRRRTFNLLYLVSSKFIDEVVSIFHTDLNYDGSHKWIYKFDFPLIDKWSREFLNSSDFTHCFLVKEFVLKGSEYGFDEDFEKRIDALNSSFNHDVYDLFELVDWDRRKNRLNYEFDDFEEFNELKRRDISEELTYASYEAVDRSLKMYRQIIQYPPVTIHSQQLAIDAIVESNLFNDLEIGFYTYLSFVKFQNKNNGWYISSACTDRITIHPKLAERLWSFIIDESLSSRWKLECLLCLPDDNVEQKHVNRLLEVFRNIDTEVFSFQLEKLNSYYKIDPKLPSKLFRLIYKNNRKNEFKVLLRGESFIFLIKEKEDFNLIQDAYLQQERINEYFDSNGNAFTEIIDQDSFFIDRLVNYLKSVESNHRRYNSDHGKLMRVWELEEAPAILEKLLLQDINSVEYTSFGSSFFDCFLRTNHKYESLIVEFTRTMVKKYSNSDSILNLLISTIHENRQSQFNLVFQDFLNTSFSVETFKKINWTKHQTVFSGTDNADEIRGQKWVQIKELVENAQLGIKANEIVNYLDEKIDKHLNPPYRRRLGIWSVDKSLY